ncbi:hypothetical protein QUB62_20825 [Microcoleus sp. A2-D3]|uniref:hypothetical protein n=1 Tax=Microcoleus sp. A2-D3 TaxID=2818537 RepID=UPI002FD328C0
MLYIFLVVLTFDWLQRVAVGCGRRLSGVRTYAATSRSTAEPVDHKSLSSVKLVFAKCLSSVSRSLSRLPRC